MRKIKEIDKEVINLITNASQSSHPKEFAGILRADGKRITEVLILPGTYSSERSVLMKLNTLPISSNACGSVHSHPSQKATPSRADLTLFDKLGQVHIILASPYNEASWKAFDKKGKEINLEVVETEGRETDLDTFMEDFMG